MHSPILHILKSDGHPHENMNELRTFYFYYDQLEADPNAPDECHFDLRKFHFAKRLTEIHFRVNDPDANVCVDFEMTGKRHGSEIDHDHVSIAPFILFLGGQMKDLFVDHGIDGGGLKKMGHEDTMKNEFMRFVFTSSVLP